MKTQIGKVGKTVLAYTYVERGRFTLIEKPMPRILDAQDAIVRVTLASICASDLHIRQGSVPRAVPGVTVGHEMVGVVEETGPAVTKVRVGDRVAVNVETFCGECFFCQNGFVNNCTHPLGGWALGCRIDGGQAPYVRVPLANQGLNRIPASVSDAQALFVGDILATIGAGPTGLCALSCALLKSPARVIVCEKDAQRRAFAARWYPQALVCAPEEAEEFVRAHSAHGGADAVLEVAGAEGSFDLAWKCARPNATVTVVAMYDRPQILPLPEMYGKNLTFKTGGVDGCDCDAILAEIAAGRLDTTPLITHTYPLQEIAAAYDCFENRRDGAMKVAIVP